MIAQHWMADAACAGTDVEAFHPAKGGHPDPKALRLCRSCPVRAACLDYALAYEAAGGPRAGVYGGTTPAQRAAIARRRAA